MKLTVLGASGATGRELTRQALQRGHDVTAVARNLARITVPDSGHLTRVAADVYDTEAITDALAGSAVILSGLGTATGDRPGVLTTGARAAVAACPDRIIWLGAFGTGASAAAAGPVTRAVLRVLLRAELGDKVTADHTVLKAGGTVFHCGPLSDKPVSSARRTVTLGQVPRRIFPAGVSRATVAAAMLDEAEEPLHPAATLVPLDR